MNIRKYLLSAAFAVAMLTSIAPGAQAATATGNFNVTVTLTSQCTMAAIGDLAFGTYTAFQGGALVATPTTATSSCTRESASSPSTTPIQMTRGEPDGGNVPRPERWMLNGFSPSAGASALITPVLRSSVTSPRNHTVR